jgi:hypothetical protein
MGRGKRDMRKALWGGAIFFLYTFVFVHIAPAPPPPPTPPSVSISADIAQWVAMGAIGGFGALRLIGSRKRK